ncbi:restriction endonuclease subunit S [Vibrio cholerae]|uniref:restriction endonuclease subunit S n=1 Tax=Vibrio cholerae TaxID=666 RepID=UPI001158DFEB|nr:restriction endonuclease subunit S [Vibrio cholerae]EHE6926311.1 hypothetical protein [Vibrio cholerae]EJX7572090.1 restriction endonuclease subunit S [Vibrio cholerae]EKF9745619.1 restriction endonuclease subunit S [Vibrio cholerae]TQP67120.1 hypothetical protein FLL76_04935 [Vibrio cholerae]TQP91970.1 hypothetical protein FLL73_18975 [Vibrio cholerae]
MSWALKRLSEVALINPRRPAIVREDSVETSFVPMEAVDEVLGEVTQTLTQPYSKVKKGYTYFEDGDVIFAKITPCMQNGKHAVVSNLSDNYGFGSTEFHVVRPSEDIVSEWIHFYLRRKETLDAAVKTFTGAVGQQRVPASFLENLEIPVPPPDEQLKIVARLKAQLAEVETARQAAQVQLGEITVALNRAIEHQIKEVISSSKNMVKLGEVAGISAKLVQPEQEEYADLPHVSAENIESITGRLLNIRSAKEDGMTSGKYLFDAGDILYSKLRPYLRKVARPAFGGLCSADMYPIKTNESLLSMDFLKLLLTSNFFTDYANEKSARSRMPKLNREQLFDFEFSLPSLEKQEQCVELVGSFMELSQQASDAAKCILKDIEKLPARILAQAFEN